MGQEVKSSTFSVVRTSVPAALKMRSARPSGESVRIPPSVAVALKVSGAVVATASMPSGSDS